MVGKTNQGGAALGRSGSLTREAQPEGRTLCPAGAARSDPRDRAKAGLKKDLEAPAAMPMGLAWRPPSRGGAQIDIDQLCPLYCAGSFPE